MTESVTKDHPNILKLFEYYEDDKSIQIISEYLAGGDLLERMANPKFSNYFTENYVAFVMSNILQAVRYCHERDIIHRLN